MYPSDFRHAMAVDGTSPTLPPPAFHLLEITLISAQDLHPDSTKAAYAVAWVRPERKLRTRVDPTGGVDPNWNDKLVFAVDAAFLRSDTSSVTIDIFSSRRVRRDLLVGTVRLVVSSVAPSSESTRFVALQVRRPRSLRPQGIINVGVSLVDTYMHTVRMDSDAAFALKDIVDSPVRSSLTCDGHRNVSRNVSRGSNVGSKMMEREAELKLEKWRIEMSPINDAGRGSSRREKRRSSPSCFCVLLRRSGERLERA